MRTFEHTIEDTVYTVCPISYFVKSPDYSCIDSDMDHDGYSELEYEIFDKEGNQVYTEDLDELHYDFDSAKLEAEVIDFLKGE